MPKIYFASDHAGFDLKRALITHFETLGHEIEDFGAHEFDAEDDYPDFVTPLAKKIAGESDSLGVVIGGSGQGEAMCANRVAGVRAVVFYGPHSVTTALEIEGGKSEDGYDGVRLARKHNDANVLSIGARFVSGEEASTAVQIFLDTQFSGADRHKRRIAKF